MRISLVLLVLLMFVVHPGHAAQTDYIIGEGDSLEISVWGSKDLNFSAKVRPDGKITVPGLGDIASTGITSEDLQKVLTDKLKTLVKNPIVTVSVKEATNSKVYIFGGGVKSGVYDVNRRTSLLQILCTIGEVRTADLTRAYVLRNGKKVKDNFQNLFIGGNTAEDFLLEPNDSLYIPLATEKNVYVLGAVTTPKYIEFREGMTIMEAILEAGNFTKFAKQNDTAILRKVDGKEISIPVRAKDLLKDGDLSQNVRLKAGDYVIVKEGMF